MCNGKWEMRRGCFHPRRQRWSRPDPAEVRVCGTSDQVLGPGGNSNTRALQAHINRPIRTSNWWASHLSTLTRSSIWRLALPSFTGNRSPWAARCWPVRSDAPSTERGSQSLTTSLGRSWLVINTPRRHGRRVPSGPQPHWLWHRDTSLFPFNMRLIQLRCSLLLLICIASRYAFALQHDNSTSTSPARPGNETIAVPEENKAKTEISCYALP